MTLGWARQHAQPRGLPGVSARYADQNTVLRGIGCSRKPMVERVQPGRAHSCGLTSCPGSLQVRQSLVAVRTCRPIWAHRAIVVHPPYDPVHRITNGFIQVERVARMDQGCFSRGCRYSRRKKLTSPG
jgi:hypothetical protein